MAFKKRNSIRKGNNVESKNFEMQIIGKGELYKALTVPEHFRPENLEENLLGY